MVTIDSFYELTYALSNTIIADPLRRTVRLATVRNVTNDRQTNRRTKSTVADIQSAKKIGDHSTVLWKIVKSS